jgi:HEAT repeat protein
VALIPTLLRDPIPAVRIAAVCVLLESATDLTDLVEQLQGLAYDTNDDVRWWVAVLIQRSSLPNERSVPILQQLAADSSDRVRIRGAYGLILRGLAEPVPGLFLSGLRTSLLSETRSTAAAGLGRVPQLSPQEQDALIRALDDPDSLVKVSSLYSLVAHKVSTPSLRERVLQLRDGKDELVQAAAKFFLDRTEI